MQNYGKILIILGVLIGVFGLLLYHVERIPLLGKLPGDILIRRENFTFYFPLTSSLILGLLISLIFKFLNN